MQCNVYSFTGSATDSNPMLFELSLLSSNGYVEIGDFSTKKCHSVVKCRFLKRRLDSVLAYHLLLLALRWGRDASALIMYYMIIISGIETNPGPKDQKERKRYRKSGMRYSTYLRCSESFDLAPSKLKDAVNHNVNENIDAPSDRIQKEADMAHHSSDSDDTSAIQLEEPTSSKSEELPHAFEIDPDLFDEFNPGDENDDVNSATSESEENSEKSWFLFDSESESDEFPSEDKAYMLGEDFAKMTLYEGAQVSLGTSILLLMTFVLNHNLTGEAFADLLELIQLHCKESNILPSSTNEIKKWFRTLKANPKKHYYCSECLMKIDEKSRACPNQMCQKQFKNKRDKSFFHGNFNC